MKVKFKFNTLSPLTKLICYCLLKGVKSANNNPAKSQMV